MSAKLDVITPGTFCCREVTTIETRKMIEKGKLVSIVPVKELPKTQIMTIDTYLCAYCDNTHLVLTDVFGNKAWNFDLVPKDAEALGMSLINPVTRS